MGFARVFSGVLKRGSKVFVIHAKDQFTSKDNYQEEKQKSEEMELFEVKNIYIMMAQLLDAVD